MLLSEGSAALPDKPLVFHRKQRKVYYVAQTRGSQCLGSVKFGSRAHQEINRRHLEISEIVLAPNAFKGCLTASEAAAAMEAAFLGIPAMAASVITWSPL